MDGNFLIAVLSLIVTIASWRLTRAAYRGDWKRFRVEQEQLQIRLLSGFQSTTYRSGEVIRAFRVLVENRSLVEVRIESITAFLRIRSVTGLFSLGDAYVFPHHIEGWNGLASEEYLLELAQSFSVTVREDLEYGGALVSFPTILASGKLTGFNISLTTPEHLEPPSDRAVTTVLIGAKMLLHDDTSHKTQAKGWNSPQRETV